MSAAELHPATVMEEIADAQPEAPALEAAGVSRTWAELDERGPRFASVGLMLRNCNEYMEAHHGIYKARCVPVNVNYRYRDEELAYLLSDCECRALVFDAEFAPLVAALGERRRGLELLVCVDDGSADPEAAGFPGYEAVLAGHEPAPRQRRSPEDPYLFYTGGTTGMPKGMAMNVGARLSEAAVRIAVDTLCLPPELNAYGAAAAARLRERGEAPRSLPAAPLMHSTAINAAAVPTLLCGGLVITCRTRSFEPRTVLEAVGESAATTLTVGGDALAKPLLMELDRARAAGEPHSVASLRALVSAGMAWSQEVKAGLLRHLPDACLVDLYGSTEGLAGMQRVRRGDRLSPVPTFEPVAGMKLLDPGGAEITAPHRPGLVAFPVAEGERYHRDEEKTRETFRDIDGVRYAIPGDWGELEIDGTMRPIGRGAKVINTGGEKVFAEEVEGVIRELPAVVDCLVLGVPSERWGEQVVALVAPTVPGALSERAVRDGVRARLADYKVPKSVAFAAEIPRHANSKADFEQARRLLTGGG